MKTNQLRAPMQQTQQGGVVVVISVFCCRVKSFRQNLFDISGWMKCMFMLKNTFVHRFPKESSLVLSCTNPVIRYHSKFCVNTHITSMKHSVRSTVQYCNTTAVMYDPLKQSHSNTFIQVYTYFKLFFLSVLF